MRRTFIRAPNFPAIELNLLKTFTILLRKDRSETCWDPGETR
jgi:hypothetical protein